jgi:D-arabinose 1-dehydrogenase-like Zn-dependent alcohol dehydrogenase
MMAHVNIVDGGLLYCQLAQVPGISYDGGYADYMITPREAVTSIPDELSAAEAAPMMCAGITTYNALRNSGACIGDVVAIFGVGRLGHLGIQFACKMGFKTIAIGREKDKEELVRKLGASHYIDSKSQDPVEELVKLSSTKIILGTGPGGKAMSTILGGLAVNGKLITIGASDEPIEVSPSFSSLDIGQ